MRRIIKTALILVLFLSLTKSILAQNVAGTSAVLSYNGSKIVETDKYFKTKLAIKKIFEKYNSPLVSSVDAYIEACTTYQLDCYLLPAISGHESSFGQYIVPNSYNTFGWGGGEIRFKNWSDGILTVAKGLREGYLNHGAATPETIGPIYAQSYTWSAKVNAFMSEFKKEEEKIQLYSPSNQVKL